MGRLVKVRIGERDIWIEPAEDVEAQRPGPELTARRPEDLARDAAQGFMDTIRAYCSLLVEAFKEGSAARPDKVTAEFGLSLSGEGNVFVVKTGAQASVKVAMEWDMSKGAR